MSRASSFKRRNRTHRIEHEKLRAATRKGSSSVFSKAAERAIDIMAAGIADEFELEAILAKARPESREKIRARLEPHLGFRRRDPLVTLVPGIRDSIKADG